MHMSILQFFKHCPYRMMMLFSEVGVLLGIEDFDCIILQVKQASSTPYMPLDILLMFYKVSTSYLPSTIALKAKYYFMSAIILNQSGQWNHGMWWWWRFHCKWVDSVRINNQCRLVILASYNPRNHKIWYGPGKSAGSSSFRISTDISLVVSRIGHRVGRTYEIPILKGCLL